MSEKLCKLELEGIQRATALYIFAHLHYDVPAEI